MKHVISHFLTIFLILLIASCSRGSGSISNISLSSLSIVDGNLDQVFQPAQTGYTATVGFLARSIKISATTSAPGATITVNGTAIGADNISEDIQLVEGNTNNVSIVVTDGSESKKYLVSVTRDTAASFAQEAYIKASSTTADDWFGYSVALSGDTLAVGAYKEDSKTTGINSTPVIDGSADDSGAVYVFTRSGSTWTQQAYIKAHNTGASDQFGWSIAIDGDTLVVGATGEASSTSGINSTPDDAAASAGAVYVFTRSDITWTQQAYIKASNAEAADFFGRSVAVYGDTLAVGAYLEDSSTTGINSTPNEGAASAGAAYVFVRSGTTWTQQAYIKASNTGASDWFGNSIALYGDTLAVGAWNEEGGEGAVYVFTRSGTTWTQQAYLKSSNKAAGDYVGYSVALSGDTLVTGAYGEDSSTTGINTTSNDSAVNSGAAYIFTRSGTTWSQQAYIKASNTGADDNFGRSVAVHGNTVAVGATAEDSSTTGINTTSDETASNSGAVYVFTRTGTTWTQNFYIKASNTGAHDYFGGAGVALSGDTLAAGAYGEDSSTTGINPIQNDDKLNTGAVYVFE